MVLLTSDLNLEENVVGKVFENIDQLFVNGLVSGVIAIVFNIILAMFVRRITNRIIQKMNMKHKAMIIKIKDIVLYVLLGISILYQFTFMGNLMTTLLASGGIVAVVVGLASQEAASNIVSGMMILFSKPFVIGDVIVLKQENLRGTVTDINMNHTIIETIDKNSIMIPNTVMSKAIIENITQESDFKHAYIYMDVSYESNLEKAIQIMKDVIVNHPLFFDLTKDESEEKVPVHCMEFKDSGISLRAKVTVRSVGDGFQLSSDCRIAIKKAFDENGIEIPYPHVQIVK